MLLGSRRLNETIHVEYTQIHSNPPGDGGERDEAWRASACGRHVTLDEEGGMWRGVEGWGRTRRCVVRDSCTEGAKSRFCDPHDLAMLPVPGYWGPKLVLSNPYPILTPAGRYCGPSG